MKNRYEIRGEETVIFLEKKDGQVIETFISTSDLEKVNSFPNTWHAHEMKSGFYVDGNTSRKEGKRRTVRLHRWIFDEPEGMVIDHFDNDTLNNKRDNLRIATVSENGQNRKGPQKNSKSGVRGVYWVEKLNKWRAVVRLNRKNIFIGHFDDIKDAEKAVSEARAEILPYSKDAHEAGKGN